MAAALITKTYHIKKIVLGESALIKVGIIAANIIEENPKPSKLFLIAMMAVRLTTVSIKSKVWGRN